MNGKVFGYPLAGREGARLERQEGPDRGYKIFILGPLAASEGVEAREGGGRICGGERLQYGGWIREKLGRGQEDRPFRRLLLLSWQDDGSGRTRRIRYRQEIVKEVE